MILQVYRDRPKLKHPDPAYYDKAVKISSGITLRESSSLTSRFNASTKSFSPTFIRHPVSPTNPHTLGLKELYSLQLSKLSEKQLHLDGS